MSAAALQALASAWLAFMGERAVAGSIALPLVAVAWFVARRRGSPHLTSALLLLSLLPLVLPLERLVPSSVVPRPLAAAFASLRFGDGSSRAKAQVPALRSRGRKAPPSTVGASAAVDDGNRAVAPPSIDATPEPAAAARDGSGASLAIALFAGWLAVVAALLLHLAVDLRRTAAALRRARPLARSDLPSAPAELARRAGLDRLPPLVESGELPAPSTCGLLAATVVLPPELRAVVGDEGLRFVLLHELAHVRRRDPLVALLERLIRIAWFLHPTAWLAGSLLARERERACDDAALVAFPLSARQACAEALYRVVERSSGRAPLGRAALALSSGGRAVKERLLRIVDPAARVASRMSLRARAAVGLCVAALLLVLAARVAPQAATAAAPQSAVSNAAPADEEAAPRAAAVPADPAVAALRNGLAWLLRHQEEDGHFSAGEFAAHCKDPACSGKGEGNADIGVTALAAEALLGAGDADEEGEAAARALDWLVKQQDRKGFIAPAGKAWSHRNYGHVLATLALVDGAGSEAGDRFKQPAQRAIDWLLEARNPYRGWRYGVRDGDNDSSLTGLIVFVLAGAKSAGLEVEAEALRSGVSFLDEMTDGSSGRTGYQQKGGFPARFQDVLNHFPAQKSESLTAVAMNARLGVGEQLPTSPSLAKGVALLQAQPPSWDEAAGTTDFYYWYHATRALFLLRGAAWREWKGAVVRELTAHQCTEGHGAGSFPPADAWSDSGGRVYATAINLLTLEICSRDR